MKNSDFKEVNGKWKMPYKTEIYKDNILIVRNTVKSIKLNAGLSKSLFVPGELKSKGFGMGDMMETILNPELGE